MALIARIIHTYGLDLTIAISLASENMERAHHRDLVGQQEFFFFRIDGESIMSSIN